MAAHCDPKGLCPRCGYQNGAGSGRCLRCRQVLTLPKGCSGACTQCLIKSIVEPVEKKG